MAATNEKKAGERTAKALMRAVPKARHNEAKPK